MTYAVWTKVLILSHYLPRP